MKVILLRFGEIWLKGNNKNLFERRLIANIKDALRGFEYKFVRERARYYISEYNENDESRIIDRLTCVFGLSSLSLASSVNNTLTEIKREVLNVFRDSVKSFCVKVKRADKTFELTSIETAVALGSLILEKYPNLKVDLHNPEYIINVDIRESGRTYIYENQIECAGGLPVGSSGRALALLSGGIDSPVAIYEMAKRGMKISAIHFHSIPYTSELAKQKVIDLAKAISKYSGAMKVYMIPFTDIQLAIHRDCKDSFMITVMRRIMIRIAKRIMETCKAGALITGESLGQVASQTLESIISTQDAAENTLIFRPLIGFDKIETIKIAKKIGTYDTSVLAYEDCCTVFLPPSPVISPKLDDSRYQESKIDNLDDLINEAIEKLEVINIEYKN